jgi:hypothetical protein
MGQYLAKAFVPFDINAFHVFHPIATLWDSRFILSSLAILALASIAWQLRGDRKILFLCGFLPVVLLPVMNISGIGANIFADRYLYIPSLGSCLLIPLIVRYAGRWRAAGFGVYGTKIAAGFLAGLSLIYTFMLARATFIWRDNFTLYTETLKRSPDSSIMADNLAELYFSRGEIKEAEYWLSRARSNYERAFIKDKNDLYAYYARLSSIYLRQGKIDEALDCLEKS